MHLQFVSTIPLRARLLPLSTRYRRPLDPLHSAPLGTDTHLSGRLWLGGLCGGQLVSGLYRHRTYRLPLRSLTASAGPA